MANKTRVNIGGDANDLSYRYYMPTIVARVEGRGNGIKTVVVNLVDIAKALHVEPSYVLKYFALELGAQSKYNSDTERAVVNGCHSEQKLAKLLNKFIDIFVLCPVCRLPEITPLQIHKQRLCMQCAACGARTDPPATSHKLVSYVVKQQLKHHTEQKSILDTTVATEAPVTDTDVELPWFTDVSKEAVQVFSFDLPSSHQKKMFWNQARKREELMEHKVSTSFTPADMFQELEGRSMQEKANAFKRIQTVHNLDDYQSISLLLFAVVDVNVSPKRFVAQYKEIEPLLKELVWSEPQQIILLQSIERQVGELHPQFSSCVGPILQVFYETSIVEEDVILSWYHSSDSLVTKDVATNIRQKAYPFIVWLQTAEEESDST